MAGPVFKRPPSKKKKVEAPQPDMLSSLMKERDAKKAKQGAKEDRTLSTLTDQRDKGIKDLKKRKVQNQLLSMSRKIRD